MTDAPFTETHRAALKRLALRERVHEDDVLAADAALAEIDRLDETHDYWQERAEKAEAEIDRLTARGNNLQHELLDLITLMPDTQTQEIIDYIVELRAIRARRDRT